LHPHLLLRRRRLWIVLQMIRTAVRMAVRHACFLFRLPGPMQDPEWCRGTNLLFQLILLWLSILGQEASYRWEIGLACISHAITNYTGFFKEVTFQSVNKNIGRYSPHGKAPDLIFVQTRLNLTARRQTRTRIALISRENTENQKSVRSI